MKCFYHNDKNAIIEILKGNTKIGLCSNCYNKRKNKNRIFIFILIIVTLLFFKYVISDLIQNPLTGQIIEHIDK